MPAWKYVLLDAATEPEVDTRRPTRCLSATYFWASACAGAGPCSTGVSPARSLILRPSFGASVLTAYFAQLSCSLPRKLAPPVRGVTSAISSCPRQLTAAVDALIADGRAEGRADAMVVAASAPASSPSGRITLRTFMHTPNLGETAILSRCL